MEITLILHLGHHESYSLGLICGLKLLVKWSLGVGVAALVRVKVRGADDFYLQLCLGFWLNHCAETGLWQTAAASSQPCVPKSPQTTALSFQK